jgi:iron(III) transport system ATP-binding protein
MGEASILPVEVAAIAGNIATVRLGETVLSLPRRNQGIGPAELAIRPHAVHLGSGTGCSDELCGTIRRAVYGGDHVEYDVVLDGFSATIFVIDTNVSSPWQVGDPVRMTLSETGLSLLPAQTT